MKKTKLLKLIGIVLLVLIVFVVGIIAMNREASKTSSANGEQVVAEQLVATENDAATAQEATEAATEEVTEEVAEEDGMSDAGEAEEPAEEPEKPVVEKKAEQPAPTKAAATNKPAAAPAKAKQDDTNYSVSGVVDLKGDTLKLGKNGVLEFKNGGMLKNGVVVGNGTKINGSGTMFDNVTIAGTWNVPEIKSSMFADAKKTNGLQNVFALTDANVQNKVEILEGDYPVKVKSNKGACLNVKGNTDLIIDGNIKMAACKFPRYDIIKAQGRNIVIRGKGTIEGDLPNHEGKEGEWGMGIRLNGAHNATIKDITIKNCWGDCIYVGGRSTKVLIDNCTLDRARRQGVSVTSANNVEIRGGKILNIAGTAPEYGIDIEPNKNDTINNILIKNVTMRSCKGGVSVYGRAENSYIGKVTVTNCDISTKGKRPVRILMCNEAIVENNKLLNDGGDYSILADRSGKVTVNNNSIQLKNAKAANTVNVLKNNKVRNVSKNQVK